VLTIILTNLLSNAVKFCKDNPVVAVSARMDVKDNLIISIEDEGIGIPQNELAHIFDRFYRATTSSGIPGSGVGLALVKELVTLHGGEIKVQSAVGAGTRFEVIFHSCKAGSAQAERAENHV
jgi:signal transduction histidine kinase